MQTFGNQRTRSNHTESGLASAVVNQQVRNILRGGVQPKRNIGSINDPAEAETDRVADQVMRMPLRAMATPSIVSAKSTESVQRKCMNFDEDEVQRKEVPQIRMKASDNDGGGSPASAEANSAISNLGSGSPLPSNERAFFEPRFGRDLSNLRIHMGGTADAASKAINARAFTLGNNIAFARGEYTPGTQSGRRLMAHEITHTLQHGNGVNRIVRRWSMMTMHNQLCGDRRAARALSKLSRGKSPWKIIEFKKAFNRMRNDKTKVEREDERKGLRGSTDLKTKEIRINKHLSDRKAASTLYHEAFHAINKPKKMTRKHRLNNEIDARVATEKMHIRQGWSNSVRGYRNKRGKVDEKFIRQMMTSSAIYNPKGETQVGRRYDGERVIKGNLKCRKKKL